ncbi:hypothetical protein K523DRAFT_422391, partial [Schizophyllum commune Tattone D]
TSFSNPRPVFIDEDVLTTVAVYSLIRIALDPVQRRANRRLTAPRPRCCQCAVRRRRRRRLSVSSRSSI